MKYELINPRQTNLTALEQVLVNRGLKEEDISNYVSLGNPVQYNPNLFHNIDRAIQILFSHLYREDGMIYVTIDSDYDGFAAAAILLNYIHALVPTAINKIIYEFHDGKQHGIEIKKMPPGVTLAIAPDSSSNEYELHKELVDRGIDVIVLDHHQADHESEYACVVNNQLCNYPNKNLCGAGVVWKLCKRIDELIGEEHADILMDIMGTAIIGDMMDMRDIENRSLVHEALRFFSNPFLCAMQDKNAYSLGDEVTPMGVAFYIVPLVNAITRVGTQEDKRLVFESMLEWKAYDEVPSTKRGCKGQMETIVEQAVRVCTNVKNHQTRLQDAGVEFIENKIYDEHLLDHKLLIIRLRPGDVEASIRGLIANSLMIKYQRPVAILTEFNHDGNKLWSGSARGYNKSSIKDFRKFCLQSGLVEFAEGHSNACGLCISDHNFDAFVAWSDEVLKDEDFSASYKVDFIYQAESINLNDISELGKYKSLWAQEISEPLIAVENVKITSDMLTLMSRDKSPTIKIELSNGLSLLKFKSSEEEFDSLDPGQGCVILDVVGKPNINYWGGRSTPQILITDYEITRKQEFYF